MTDTASSVSAGVRFGIGRPKARQLGYVMLPIPGTSSVEHVDADCVAAGLAFSDDQFDNLENTGPGLRRRAVG